MKPFALSLLAAAVLAGTAANAQNAALPGVTIYATGGTIAGSSASSRDTTNYAPGQLGVQTLIDAVPAIKDVARVSGEQIANVRSSDVDSKVLLHLAKTINAKLAELGTHGVVVTHGTDTLAESAFFLDLTVKSPKPVVVVGAMRPATAISADGPMNLLQAVTLAASKEAEGRGTLVTLNDRIGSAFYTIKTHSSAVDTFKAAEQGYLGAFAGSRPRFWYEPARPTDKPFFDVGGLQELPRVEILYGYQDQDTSLLDAAIKNGARGIVIDASGNGSLNTLLSNRVQELDKQGFPVIVATRTNSGFVTTRTEGIGSGAYSASKARWLLTLALAKGDSIERIKRYFNS